MTDGLCEETPFDDTELGEGFVRAEDAQCLGLVEIEAGYCWRCRRLRHWIRYAILIPTYPQCRV